MSTAVKTSILQHLKVIRGEPPTAWGISHNCLLCCKWPNSVWVPEWSQIFASVCDGNKEFCCEITPVSK